LDLAGLDLIHARFEDNPGCDRSSRSRRRVRSAGNAVRDDAGDDRFRLAYPVPRAGV